jgi:hypothetical protein
MPWSLKEEYTPPWLGAHPWSNSENQRPLKGMFMEFHGIGRQTAGH